MSLDKLLSSGVVAVMRKLPVEDIENIASALIEGGISGLEITLDSDDALGVIERLSKLVGDRAVVGAGTVLSSEQAEAAIDAGAKFVFAPILDKGTIEVAKRRETIVIPGVFTPTEAYQAIKWGADVVKVFPADCVGPSFIKSVKGPLPMVRMMPTGGVDLTNLASFIKAGAVAVGAGGSLLDKNIIAARDWPRLTALAKQYVNCAQTARGN
ncbi:bifunctional 4-hydroxy-2-oxoglutarate aldolase/2-dehydro-3-deoxy-phosphogluconate aldolase [Shouchella clausii]|uniref:bifunctional 4-hydroxy-2-oxoglutarate aldolase/2-dehydro-3-deoxy-phosphogluconate aldolase n=1 Tax=Shouchella TaxID=2893057 RepID=UPI0004E64589|nr:MULTISPECIES: bifunctional 4-hydroxy-2-oxoglutarate aldolase/2-dehydro-3-deoxy-phosphogluconate aldolase [Shouchella]ALA53984.1 4-hydroxy-2-oxoglutarate aldolase [Shouchella clausii]MBU3229460.1 bifunctional 4-hydroxy-2-oxoglutarate aldolase/2-dehydro-3-deoxy-phosphogluconate aldolase [Shouchella clausii]MBU3265317.1 bifunctional 4-hydroxy-2-oxoglutarate aldolase/2-dehydro-3-deoxy-phosphogluconate aldolase [Shouchella clausii]MBU3506361.1 bifunctional 4-hydroxy-2-oxoglutarate aldolase/2-dehy